MGEDRYNLCQTAKGRIKTVPLAGLWTPETIRAMEKADEPFWH